MSAERCRVQGAVVYFQGDFQGDFQGAMVDFQVSGDVASSHVTQSDDSVSAIACYLAVWASHVC